MGGTGHTEQVTASINFFITVPSYWKGDHQRSSNNLMIIGHEEEKHKETINGWVELAMWRSYKS